MPPVCAPAAALPCSRSSRTRCPCCRASFASIAPAVPTAGVAAGPGSESVGDARRVSAVSFSVKSLAPESQSGQAPAALHLPMFLLWLDGRGYPHSDPRSLVRPTQSRTAIPTLRLSGAYRQARSCADTAAPKGAIVLSPPCSRPWPPSQPQLDSDKPAFLRTLDRSVGSHPPRPLRRPPKTPLFSRH